MIKDISDVFKNTNSHVLQNVLTSGGIILGLKVVKFYGGLIQDENLSNNLQNKISRETGVKGFISTDELPRYGITNQEKKQVEKLFDLGKKDIVVIVADQKDKAEAALNIIEKELAGKKIKVPKPKTKAKVKKAAKAKKTKPKKAKKATPKKKVKKKKR